MSASLLELFSSHYRKISHLGHTIALLHQDQETSMPSQAGAGRAEQIGVLASLSHQACLDPEYVDVLTQLHAMRDDLDSKEQRMIDLAYKDLKISQSVSEEFIASYESLKSQSQQARQQARQENNFALFQPFLEKMVAMTKEYAKSISPEKDCYDTLLDLYEEDATQERYDSVLLPLQEPLTSLLKKVATDSPAITRACKVEDRLKLDAMIRQICADVGYNWKRGAMASVTHPFMTTLGADDYRIHTRYTHLTECLGSMVHELGHGLYEMNNDASTHYTPLAGGVSLGIHESQSRTLENIVGRSPEFMQYLVKTGRQYLSDFPDTEKLLTSMNHVQRSFIRTESDEISYNLHILLRYQIEKELFSDQLSVSDLPSRWNELMKAYLGIVPESDAQGCLQDVHRSCGLFGYFPTYMLGNLYGAQFWDTCKTEYPDIMKQIEQGNFSSYHSRHREHIRQHGKLLKPRDLLKKATGKDLDSSCFLKYLEEKYGK